MSGKRVAPRSYKVKIKAGKPVAAKDKKKRKSLGFTNRLALLIMLLLAAGMFGGFVLAWRSISYGYTGALVCFTVAFTPLGTAISIVLGLIVNKSKAENTGANGEGIVYAKAMANNFADEESEEDDPAI